MNKILLFTLFSGTIQVSLAQQGDEQQSNDLMKNAADTNLVKPKFQQQPGLALAASKIFFSDKRWSVSGFGEYNYVPLQQNVSAAAGDLELYYSGLYRQAVFFGYKLTDKLIWNSEFQIEFLHYKDLESHHEIVIEAFVDYLFKEQLKARFGFYPLTIGYVNNNDEPVMFYSVNRSEVERLITPSTWIEFGAMLYGNIDRNWSYALGFSQGLNSRNYLSGSWIRQGREVRFGPLRSIAVNPQLTYTDRKGLTVSASGYYGNSGQGDEVMTASGLSEIKGRIDLTTAYIKYDRGNFRFITVGTYGKLGDTEKIFERTKDEAGENGQVLGSRTFGYLFETGFDVLPYLQKSKTLRPHKKTFLYDNHDMKLSFFGRYERLNTHRQIHRSLMHLPRNESNMRIYTVGVNFNTKENIVLKANYQFRRNLSSTDPEPVKNIVETGVGFIF